MRLFSLLLSFLLLSQGFLTVPEAFSSSSSFQSLQENAVQLVRTERVRFKRHKDPDRFYSIKVPRDWTVTDEGARGVFYCDKGDLPCFQVNSFKIPEGEDIQFGIEGFEEGMMSRLDESDIIFPKRARRARVGRYRALKKKYILPENELYYERYIEAHFIEREGYMYFVNLVTLPKEDRLYKSTFRKILRSVRLNPQKQLLSLSR